MGQPQPPALRPIFRPIFGLVPRPTTQPPPQPPPPAAAAAAAPPPFDPYYPSHKTPPPSEKIRPSPSPSTPILPPAHVIFTPHPIEQRTILIQDHPINPPLIETSINYDGLQKYVAVQSAATKKPEPTVIKNWVRKLGCNARAATKRSHK